MNNILLCASNLSVKAVRRWLQACRASSVESLKVPISHGAGHFWMLNTELSQKEIIKLLSERGIIALERNVEGLKAVYVPPPDVARGKIARFN